MTDMLWENGSKVAQLEGSLELISASIDKTVMVLNADYESNSAGGLVTASADGEVAVSEVETGAGLGGGGGAIEPGLGGVQGAEESQLGLGGGGGGAEESGLGGVGGAEASQLEVETGAGLGSGGGAVEPQIGQLEDAEGWVGASSYGDVLRRLYKEAVSLEYELEKCWS